MTRDEFVSKFKVGDKVRHLNWQGENPVRITSIGESLFLGCSGARVEDCWVIDNDWVKVEESKKPSEEIRKIADDDDSFEVQNRHIIKWLDENWPKVQQLKENK